MKDFRMSHKEAERIPVISAVIEQKITQACAAKKLGISIRQVKRLCQRFRTFGAEGLCHKSRGKPSGRKIPKEQQNLIETLLKEKYFDFGPTLASEALEENEGICVGREFLRLTLDRIGLRQITPKESLSTKKSA